jgi:ribokinase
MGRPLGCPLNAVRRHRTYGLRDCRGNLEEAVVRPFDTGALREALLVAPRFRPHHLTGAGNLEPLRYALTRLQLGHGLLHALVSLTSVAASDRVVRLQAAREPAKEADVARVTVVGSCNMDLVSRTDHFPRPGEHLLASAFGTFLGGKGANQAVAACRAGASVHMVARVGADGFGDEIVRTLESIGINVAGIRRDRGSPTGNASIWLDTSGQNQILVFPGANGTLGPIEALAELHDMRVGDVLLMQLEVPMRTVMEAARVGAAQGAMVVLNAAPAASLPDDLWRYIDVLVVNETEAATLSGGLPPIEAASALRGKGRLDVVVTLGSDGCLVTRAGDDASIHLSAFTPGAVVDATGAGDAFCGAMVAQLAAGSSLQDAARSGNAAGSLAVEVLGAIPSMPSQSQIAMRLTQAV